MYYLSKLENLIQLKMLFMKRVSFREYIIYIKIIYFISFLLKYKKYYNIYMKDID